MATNAVLFEISADQVAQSLLAAVEKLNAAGGELLLDFSAVRRLDAAALQALDNLADRADAKRVKVLLRSVSVEVYRVLKLVKLAPHFGFVT